MSVLFSNASLIMSRSTAAPQATGRPSSDSEMLVCTHCSSLIQPRQFVSGLLPPVRSSVTNPVHHAPSIENYNSFVADMLDSHVKGFSFSLSYHRSRLETQLCSVFENMELTSVQISHDPATIRHIGSGASADVYMVTAQGFTDPVLTTSRA